MKTFLKTRIIPILSVILSITLTNTDFALAAKKSVIDKVQISAFNRVIVSGNVEVVLISRPTIGICYEDNNGGTVKVMQSGYNLHIKGTSAIPAKVLLYVNNIYRIEAFDKAIVSNESKFEVKYLQIIIKNNAQVNMHISADGLYTSITDNSILKLEGRTNDYTLITDGASKFIANNFMCKKLNTDKSINNLKNQSASILKP